MEFLRSSLRRHFAGKPVVTSRNFGCFLMLGVAVTRCCIVPKGDELNYKLGLMQIRKEERARGGGGKN